MLNFEVICFLKFVMRMNLSNHLQESSIVLWMMDYRISAKY